jgi:hypothetical protein
MATSLSMALESCGIDADEDTVNKVMGAAPMHGASWEQAFAASQHFGARVTFICPATLAQVKAYTDKGVAVMIAWNPEGRPWSHASVIKDVDDEGNVTVADPNIPDPDVLTRTLPKAEFYGKWYEKWESYLVRRPAMAVEREVSPEGRQMVASTKVSMKEPYEIHGFTDEGKKHIVSEASSEKSAYKIAVQFKREGYVGYIITPEKQKIYFHMLTPTFRKFGLENVMNPIVARVAARHMQAFQFALAQAFADQVGMPEHMNVKMLDALLRRAFDSSVDDLEWELADFEIDMGTATAFGETHYSKDYYHPDETDEVDVDVPVSASCNFTATMPLQHLANWLTRYPKTQFFHHHYRDILKFFMSPSNRRLLEKFFEDMPVNTSGVPWDDYASDSLKQEWNENSGSVNGSGSISSGIGDATFEFDGRAFQFKASVAFDYYNEDLSVEVDDEPDDYGKDEDDYDY